MSTEDEPRSKRLTFEPTINAGHLLTFIGMAVSVFVGWSMLDKRVVVLEEAKIYQVRRDDQQDTLISEKLADIRDAIKDVRRGVDELRRDQKTTR